jgi:hypothetical protein
MSRAGLRRNAVYLIRPDGYVGLADPAGSATAIASYLDARKLAPMKKENGPDYSGPSSTSGFQ